MRASTWRESVVLRLLALLCLLLRLRLRHPERLQSAGPMLLLARYSCCWELFLLRHVLPSDCVIAFRPWQCFHIQRYFPAHRCLALDADAAQSRQQMEQRLTAGGRVLLLLFDERPQQSAGPLPLSFALMRLIQRLQLPLLPLVIVSPPLHWRLIVWVVLGFSPAPVLAVLSARCLVPLRCHGAAARQQIREQFAALSGEIALHSHSRDRTLWQELAWLRQRQRQARVVMADFQGRRLGLWRLSAAAIALSRHFPKGRCVGLMLPNTVACLIAFFALQKRGQTAAMLNFTSGGEGLLRTARLGQLAAIVSSRRFVEKAGLQREVALLAAHFSLLYLEDMAAAITPWRRFLALLQSAVPRVGTGQGEADSAALLLFTSGSESEPKGVLLSHRALVTNLCQIRAVFPLLPEDRVFNALPMFHAFGLTVGSLLPLFSDATLFLYPSPRDYHRIPSLIEASGSSLLIAAASFLSRYGRMASAQDFHRLRAIFSGAEALSEQTDQYWQDHFGLHIYEGYGLTEASPVVAVNTAQAYKRGSVGRLLPGIEWRIAPLPENTQGGGRLWLRGDNLMTAYQTMDGLQPLAAQGGWHDSGDLVRIDEQGFLYLIGRARRFIKRGGEMVSLAALEHWAMQLWPQGEHAVVVDKAERIWLFSSTAEASREALQEYFKQQGISPLGLPWRVVVLSSLPRLAIGKPDYPALTVRIAAIEKEKACL